MIRHSRLLIPAAFAALLVGTVSVHADTVVRVVDHPIVSAAPLNIEQVRQRIVLAATQRGWTIDADGPQSLRATIAAGRGAYEAVVNITFSATAYSITLVESKGFGQRGDQINGRANRWIRNLEADIENMLERPV